MTDGGPLTEPGFLTEGTETVEIIEISDTNLVEVTFTLTWVDEPAATGPGSFENQPDRFILGVDTPEGITLGPDQGENTPGGQGTLSVIVEYQPYMDPFENGTGSYNVTIRCDNAGDHTPLVNIIGVREEPDDGNDWTLDVSYHYYEKKQG